MADPKYPEHQKLKAGNHKTEIIHEFLEWVLERHQIELTRAEIQRGAFEDHYKHFELSRRERDQLLAEFIGVDLEKIEDEKQAMIDEMRELNEKKS